MECEALPKDWDKYSPDQKESYLKATADAIEERPIERPISDEEEKRLKHEYIQLRVQIKQLEKRKKEIMDSYKEALAPKKKEAQADLEAIQNKKIQTEEKVYEIREHEQGLVYEVLSDGVELSRRKMMPSERQATLHSLNRNEGTNDQ